MDTNTPTIYVVDDDLSVRRSVDRLLRSAMYHVRTFSAAEDFLELEDYDHPCCLILDVTMPGLSGLDIQERLVSNGNNVPIIFVTGHGTIAMSVRALKNGAVNFLEKPIDQRELLSEIEIAIEQNLKETNKNKEISHIKQHVSLLTPREKEVFELVVMGYLNKQIAAQLNVCEKTIKVHRARVMKKMNVKSLAELVHQYDIVLNNQPPLKIHTYRR
ncbi:MAG: response regulator transcription factor [Desulfobulbaceae bacterium]|nr:response regulator transcription factor [Desulfobulbaceae bacterium]